MKNPKRLTVAERLYLESINLNSDNWLISKKSNDGWLIVHKLTGRSRTIPVPWKG